MPAEFRRLHRTASNPHRHYHVLEIDYAGDSIEIGFNVTYLMDVLANMSVDMVKLELQDSNSSALMSVPDMSGFKYVVMPMRI